MFIAHHLLCMMLYFVINNKSVFALSPPHQDGKTALYWAVEKGNATMVRDILQCNPDTESCTKVQHTGQEWSKIHFSVYPVACFLCTY